MSAEVGKMAMESGSVHGISLNEEHGPFWEGYSNLVTTLANDYPDLLSIRVNYPMSLFAEFIKRAESAMRDQSLDCALQAHAGNGICRIHFLKGTDNENGGERLLAVVEHLLEHCRELGGNLIVERASPSLKPRLPIWGLPRGDQIVMKRIKEQIDPRGIFCPGRLAGEI
jgi:FAD/FMN-containing dehydrogenase